MSIVWPVMYRLDDPTETDNRGKSFSLSPLANILRVHFSPGNSLKAYLHGTTLSHATSLRQAYDMT